MARQQPLVLSGAERRLIVDAVDAGARQYFRERRGRVPAFVAAHFSFRGSRRLHRRALGLDLLRAPVNLALAMPYLGAQFSAAVLHKAGARGLARVLRRMPPGFETAVQREVVRLIRAELLELPPGGVGGKGGTFDGSGARELDALTATILAQPGMMATLERFLAPIRARAKDPNFQQALAEELGRYTLTRGAASDLAAATLASASGALAFGKLTPGALSAGPALAGLLAHQAAVSQFLFGSTLGAWYYGAFPVGISAGLIAASTGGIAAGLAVLSAFAGLAADPFQARTGIHRRRLLKLIDALEQRFFGSVSPGFRPRDQYVARLLDFIDALRGAGAL